MSNMPKTAGSLALLVAIATAAGCFTEMEDAESIGSSLTGTSNGKIFLRAQNGRYVQAVGGGGGEVRAVGAQPLGWEQLEVLNKDGHKTLQSGDQVFLRAANGSSFLQVKCGGGTDVDATDCGSVNASSTNQRSWETFEITKIGGSGAIKAGDNVALRSATGKACSALGGGGDRLTCAVDEVKGWETFTIGFASANGGQGTPAGGNAAIAGDGNFQLKDGKIYDPSGKLFVPMGFNVWPNSGGHADFYKDCWKANTVRLNHVLLDWKPTANIKYDKGVMGWTIDELLKRGLVVMVEWHEVGHFGDEATAWSGTHSYNFGSAQKHLDAIKAFHVDLANKYKDNPYVWFNIVNEPGGDPAPNDADRWVNTSKAVIEAIRATGNKSIIIADGIGWGNDQPKNNCGPVNENSGILSRGTELAALGNVAFNIHMYDGWRDNAKKPCDVSRLKVFLDKTAEKGLSVFVGEYNDPKMIDPASQVLHEREIGRLFWHVDAGDSRITTDSKGPNHCTNPTNLSALGKSVWADMHR